MSDQLAQAQIANKLLQAASFNPQNDVLYSNADGATEASSPFFGRAANPGLGTIVAPAQVDPTFFNSPEAAGLALAGALSAKGYSERRPTTVTDGYGANVHPMFRDGVASFDNAAISMPLGGGKLTAGYTPVQRKFWGGPDFQEKHNYTASLPQEHYGFNWKAKY